MSDLVFQPAIELAKVIRNQEAAASEVIEAFLAQIAAHNPALNAVVTLDETGARRRAKQADDALAKGEVWGPLHGVPVTIKDVFETEGMRTTCGHKPLAANIPDEDATVVARLRRAGAIVLGKTNMPEFAMDIQSDNPVFGATNNPWNATRTPGGSSGGEAAAVAAGMSPLGIGSDIGGSLRIPSHYCGVLGLKPTEGRVPNTGHIFPGKVNSVRHLAVSGVLARSVADLRLCLEVIAGPDGRDMTVSPVALAHVPARPLNEYRFAWSDSFGGLPVTSETKTAMNKLADDLANAGCRVEKASPPNFDAEEVWQTYGELFGMIAFANAPIIARAFVKTFGGFIFKDPVSRAAACRATANSRRYFVVLEQRDRLLRSLESFLADYDSWLCPVATTPAFPHRTMGKIHTPIDVDGEKVPGNIAGIGYTCGFNLTGHPVVVAPLTESQEGLPIGVQVVGRLWGEMALLNAAEALTQLIGAFRRPPGY